MIGTQFIKKQIDEEPLLPREIPLSPQNSTNGNLTGSHFQYLVTSTLLVSLGPQGRLPEQEPSENEANKGMGTSENAYGIMVGLTTS